MTPVTLDRRLHPAEGEPVLKSSALPITYLKEATDVFRTEYPGYLLTVYGEVYPNEVILALSLTADGCLSALTTYASVNYNAEKEKESIHLQLEAAIDALGIAFDSVLEEKKGLPPAEWIDEPLSAFESLPFEWTLVKTKTDVFVRVDKANPALDAMTDRWLEEHAPEIQEQKQEEYKKTTELFVTGPKSSTGKEESTRPTWLH